MSAATARRAAKVANPLSALGGNYYATASGQRGTIRKGYEVARQRRTLQQAMRALEDAIANGVWGGPVDRGYVQLWVDAEQRRHIVAERDEAGNWWARDRITGDLRAIDGPR